MAFLEHRIPPPVIGAAVAAAMWGASSLGPPLPLPDAASNVIVAVLVIAGLALDLAGLLAFRRSRTTINPLRPQSTSAIVTGGVYRITRNPMYLGMVLLLLAWAVYLGALLPLAGPVVFVLYMNRFQIAPEERALAARFGPEYEAYAARVRRWL
jgi:protein-S-isoprenylcysteine O-methyltransferase Ste14